MERGKWRDMKRRGYAGCETWTFDGEQWKPEKGGGRKQIRSYRDLDAFNLAYTLAPGRTGRRAGRGCP